ncbi:hypothetical protein [Polyangium mundeleinium]|uniref:Uncharacterized protein n=1 Tax=Polyangium mundeleinium TaxID=2995306 RepID=A0ABT5F5E0_9BACT|nr:hypothetical protein [Polyangium mundeleinium]MDC0749316.1 hypothetical protein [Polyangium mundeleinium]
MSKHGGRRTPCAMPVTDSCSGKLASMFQRGPLKFQPRDVFGSSAREADEYVVDQTVSLGGDGAVAARSGLFESKKDLLGRTPRRERIRDCRRRAANRCRATVDDDGIDGQSDPEPSGTSAKESEASKSGFVDLEGLRE